jgi:hypothetical protein
VKRDTGPQAELPPFPGCVAAPRDSQRRMNPVGSVEPDERLERQRNDSLLRGCLYPVGGPIPGIERTNLGQHLDSQGVAVLGPALGQQRAANGYK